MKTLAQLIIHCTATREGREVSSAEIRRWHTSPPPVGHGWKQVGYTDMFHLDGRVERLATNNEDANIDEWEVTNGAKGYNTTSRHIVYVGGLSASGQPKDTRTTRQREAMAEYVKNFHRRFPEVEIVGHHDVGSTKECPCFDVKKWIKTIL